MTYFNTIFVLIGFLVSTVALATIILSLFVEKKQPERSEKYNKLGVRLATIGICIFLVKDMVLLIDYFFNN